MDMLATLTIENEKCELCNFYKKLYKAFNLLLKYFYKKFVFPNNCDSHRLNL